MKLAVIAELLSLDPIEGADRIERATVLGWSVVVRKGLHTVGSKVILIMPDTYVLRSWVDDTYVGEERVRLKTVKMRGQYSAGLILPLSELPGTPEDWELGAEVSVPLGIEKYVAAESETTAGSSLGAFPSGIVSKTDEENFRSSPGALMEARLEPQFHDIEFVTLLKYDGSSGTFIYKSAFPGDAPQFRVCSRNNEWAEDDSNVFWKIARKYQLQELLQVYGRELAIQAEICGPGIHGNKMKFPTLDMRVFLMKDLATMQWIPVDEAVKICRALRIPHAEEVAPRFTQANFPMNDMLQETANNTKYDEGRSNAEGIVIRTAVPVPSAVLGKSWWSLKVMNQPYDTKK